MINLVILNKNSNSGSNEYNLKEIKELSNFKNETALSIYVRELNKIEQLNTIYNDLKIIDALRIYYIGETKNYKFYLIFIWRDLNLKVI